MENAQKSTRRNYSDLNPDIIVCQCQNPDHQILIYRDKIPLGVDINEPSEADDNYFKYVEMKVRLTKCNSILERIWIALKYIFNVPPKEDENHWDSIIITSDNYCPLKRIIEFIEKENGNN